MLFFNFRANRCDRLPARSWAEPTEAMIATSNAAKRKCLLKFIIVLVDLLISSFCKRINSNLVLQFLILCPLRDFRCASFCLRLQSRASMLRHRRKSVGLDGTWVMVVGDRRRLTVPSSDNSVCVALLRSYYYWIIVKRVQVADRKICRGFSVVARRPSLGWLLKVFLLVLGYSVLT